MQHPCAVGAVSRQHQYGQGLHRSSLPSGATWQHQSLTTPRSCQPRNDTRTDLPVLGWCPRHCAALGAVRPGQEPTASRPPGAAPCQRRNQGCFSYQLQGNGCSFPSLLAPSRRQAADASTVSVCSCHPDQTSGAGRAPPAHTRCPGAGRACGRGDSSISQVSPAARGHSTPSSCPHLTSALPRSHTTASPPRSRLKAEPANNLEITRSFRGSQAGCCPTAASHIQLQAEHTCAQQTPPAFTCHAALVSHRLPEPAAFTDCAACAGPKAAQARGTRWAQPQLSGGARELLPFVQQPPCKAMERPRLDTHRELLQGLEHV